MSGAHEDEIIRLRLLSAAHPNARILTHLAEAYRKAGDLERALGAADRAIDRHAEYPNAHMVRGRVLWESGDADGAEQAFRRVLELDPDNLAATECLDRLAHGLGPDGEAAPEPRQGAGKTTSLESFHRVLARHTAAMTEPEAPPRAERTHAERTHAEPIHAEPPDAGPTHAEPPDTEPDALEPMHAEPPDAEPANGERNAPAAAVAPWPWAPVESHRDVSDAPTRWSPAAPTRPSAAPAPPVQEPPIGDYFARLLAFKPAQRQAPVAPAAPVASIAPEALTPSELRQRLALGDAADAMSDAAAAMYDDRPTLTEPDIPTLTEAAPHAETGSPAPQAAPQPAPQPTLSPEPHRAGSRTSPPPRGASGRPAPSFPAPVGGKHTDLVGLVDLLTGLLEYRDPFYRGGSSLTRLIATALGREMGLEGEALEELALAAVLRDLGRLALGGRLIEKPSVELKPEARRRIESHVELALKLLDGIALPDGVRSAIRHHHERWDGVGYPDGLRGDAIPLPARILAVADSLAAMISPRPYRPPRRFAAAVAEIEAEAGSNYDPAVVHALMRILPGRLRRRVLGFGLRQHVIVVDADRGRALAVAVRLCSSGYLAQAAADPDEARERMRRYPADALVVSSDLAGDAAAVFLEALRDDDATATTPVVMLNAETVERRIDLLGRGADVCFSSDVAFDELRAALGALLKRSSVPSEPAPNTASVGGPKGQRSLWHTLQGDLTEFPLSWLLQVLNYDARTAAIVVRSGGETGTIYVEGGAATHAEVGELAGDAALQTMLRWKEGNFVVQPNMRAALRTVERSIMHLLLDTAVEDDHSSSIFGAVRTDE